jgi:hypothetical protein
VRGRPHQASAPSLSMRPQCGFMRSCRNTLIQSTNPSRYARTGIDGSRLGRKRLPMPSFELPSDRTVQRTHWRGLTGTQKSAAQDCGHFPVDHGRQPPGQRLNPSTNPLGKKPGEPSRGFHVGRCSFRCDNGAIHPSGVEPHRRRTRILQVTWAVLDR